MKNSRILILSSLLAVSSMSVTYSSNFHNDFNENVHAEATSVEFSSFSLFHNSFTNGYDSVILIFKSNIGGTSQQNILYDCFKGLKINGTTVEEWHSLYSNLNVSSTGDPSKVKIDIPQANPILKMDGTDRFTLEKGTVLPNGTVTAEKIDYICNNYVGGSGNTSSSTFVKFDVNFCEAISSKVQDNSLVTTLLFLGASGKIETGFNSVYLNDSKLLDVSGSSISWDSANQNNLNIKIPLSSLVDGESVLSIKAPFALTSEASTDKDISFRYLENYSKKFIPNYTNKGDTAITAATFYPGFNKGSTTQDMMITFSSSLLGDYDYSTEILNDHLFINGKSMREINAESNNNIVVRGWNQGGQGEKLYLTLKTALFKLDDSDTFEITAGVVTPACKVVNKTFSSTVIGKVFVATSQIVPTGEKCNIARLSLFYDVSGYDWLYVIFDKMVTSGNQNSILTSDVLNKIKVNGRTLLEILSIHSNTSVLWVDNAPQLIIHIETGVAEGFNKNIINHVEIEKGFVTENGLATENAIDSYLVDGSWINKDTAINSFSVVSGSQDATNTTLTLNMPLASGKITTTFDHIYLNSKKVSDINGANISWDSSSETNLIITIPNSNLVNLDSKIIINSGFKISDSCVTSANISLTYYNLSEKLFIKTKEICGDTHILAANFYPNFVEGAEFQDMMIVFDQSLLAASEAEATEMLGSLLKINGISMNEFNKQSSNTITVRGWNQGGQGEKLFIHIKTSCFNFDNNDVFEIGEGIITPSGYYLCETASFNLVNKKFLINVPSVQEKIALTTASIFPNNEKDGYDWLYITFEKNLTEKSVNDAVNSSLLDNIIINGYSYREILELDSNAANVLWNPQFKNKLLIKLKNDNVFSFRLDNTDRLQVLKGFVAQNGLMPDKDYDLVYSHGLFVDTSTVKDDYFIRNNTQDELNVYFDISFLLAKKLNSVDLSKFLFNNQPLNEIVNASVTWTDNNSLHVCVPKSVFADSDNVFKVSTGLEINTNLFTSKEINLKYFASYGYWAKNSSSDFPGESIEVLSLGRPRVLRDGEFVVDLKFDSELTDTRLQGFTRDFDTILNLTDNNEPGYYYTDTIINFLVIFDLPHKCLDAIKVNDIPLSEMSNAYISMYGNEIMIHILGDSDHFIRTLHGIKITVSEGFRSYNGGETDSEVSYIYDVISNSWNLD